MNNSWIVIAVCIHSVIGEAIYKRIGQSVSLKCEVETSNLDIEWTYKGVGGDKHVMIYQLNGKRGNLRKGPAPMVNRAKLKDNALEISPLEPKDAGEYICNVARVEKGRHSLYMVSVGVNPAPPLNEGSPAALYCQVSGFDSLPKVEWLKKGKVMSPNGSVTLALLTADHNGTWTCRISQDKETHSENLIIDVKAWTPTTGTTVVKGLGDHGQDRAKITPRSGTSDSQNPNKSWSKLGLSLWMWVGIGAGSLVLIILLVGCVLLHRRNRRMRKRRQMMNINRKPLKSNDYCQCKRTPEGPPQRRTRPKPSPLTLQQH
ncbi:CD4-2 molecule, tandem duplicate 2 isoform X1 [Esox lucius]|uniref:Ig-like domain-containing protein n=2 Tax=Esox lucius TaxID=8010 RepID=A0A3P9AFL6_ESOLU|nr:CD4-2 molecule, tandem duplicate 2 isoform X1 [Esox lucius]